MAHNICLAQSLDRCRPHNHIGLCHCTVFHLEFDIAALTQTGKVCKMRCFLNHSWRGWKKNSKLQRHGCYRYEKNQTKNKSLVYGILFFCKDHTIWISPWINHSVSHTLTKIDAYFSFCSSAINYFIGCCKDSRIEWCLLWLYSVLHLIPKKVLQKYVNYCNFSKQPGLRIRRPDTAALNSCRQLFCW